MFSSFSVFFVHQPLVVRVLLVFGAAWVLIKGLLATAYDLLDLLIRIIERFDGTLVNTKGEKHNLRERLLKKGRSFAFAAFILTH